MGPNRFTEEVAKNVCKYFTKHLSDDLAIAEEMRYLSKTCTLSRLAVCKNCNIFMERPDGAAGQCLRCSHPRCSVVFACGRKFCHVDAKELYNRYACQCAPKKTEPNVYKVVLFCALHASVCRMDGCNSRVCHVCKKKCPSCGKELCHKHVVKRLCIGCMQEEADAYREKWPQHAQSEQLLE